MRPSLGTGILFADQPPPKTEVRLRPLIVLLLLITVAVAGAKLVNAGDGWFDNIDDGLAAASRNGRPVFVYFGADWCPPCVQFRKRVLGNPRVVEGLKERFVLVKVDLTHRAGSNALVAQDFDVHVIPTVVLLDYQGYELERVTGESLFVWAVRKAGS